MDPGPGVLDPTCGEASYDGHSGWDIRVPWMPDIGTRVVAAGDGIVLRLRDGIADRIIGTDADRAGVADRECGNGVVISHGDGWESQYCHLRNGSVSVRPGDRVSAGDHIGGIGASGLAQFPHVHFSVRRDGERIDPLTGNAIGLRPAACGEMYGSLMTAPARARLLESSAAIMAVGLANTVPDSAGLMAEGPPPPPARGQGPLIAWSWIINIEQGWHVHLRVSDGLGREVFDHASRPLTKRKATYLIYAGRRNLMISGDYSLEVRLVDGDTVLRRQFFSISID